MNILENSPLDALAFNYLSFGFLTLFNSLWTRLAITFWRIRSPKPELLPPSDDPISDRTDPNPLVSEPDAVPEPARVPTVAGNGGADVDGVTKGKFTLYYEDDDRECESDEMSTVAVDIDEREGRSEWWESWERMLRMSVGENENGWYTSLDLMALNGNVVRLWDDELGFGAFKRETRENSSCVLVW